MIFRYESSPRSRFGHRPGVRPAFQIFLELQKLPDPPDAIVLQPHHSMLAGEIARALRPAVFGDLPGEAIKAISEHDFGWRESDEAQIAIMQSRPPRPFLRLSPEESMPAWRESVRRAQAASPLEGVVVSRHFCALGGQDTAHRPFIENESARRAPIERDLGIPAIDLARFTGAIGFCDLVSLYLCSGAREPAEFPLCHPALPESHDAPKVSLDWVDDRPRFSPPLIAEGASVSVAALEPESGGRCRPTTLAWRFVA